MQAFLRVLPANGTKPAATGRWMRCLRAALLCVLLPASTLAVPVEVSVSEVGKNAAEAKEKALRAAERKAFETYITQQAPQQAPKILAAYKDEKIGQFVNGYQVIEERISQRSYSGKFRMELSDQAMAQALAGVPAANSGATSGASESGAPAAETQSARALLVLPVLKNQKGILLWEADNNWRTAFNAAALQRGKGRLIMPYGDPNDRLSVDAGTVGSVGFAALSPLAQRYGASEILVAVAQPDYLDDSGEVEVQLRFLNAKQAEAQRVLIQTRAKDDPAKMLEEAATEIVTGLLRQSEAAANAGTAQGPVQKLEAVLRLSNARDWAEMQQRLDKISVIEGVEVLAADWQQMRLSLAYRGSPQQLGQELAHANIDVSKGEGALMLALR